MCTQTNDPQPGKDHATTFASTYDLARLPYFDLTADKELVVADPSIGPAIDMHAHLALSYLRRRSVDLEGSHPRTEHYLPLERALDFEVYVNRNFTAADLKTMERDLTLKAPTPWGMRRTHTAPNLLREMRGLGIVGTALLPIELPFISDNTGNYLDVATRHPDLIPFGSLHPLVPNRRKKLMEQKRRGARAIKMHPAVQMISPSNPRSISLFEHCGDLGLPVFFHCGPVDIEPPAGRRRSQVRLYEKPIAEQPKTTFVLGHSGALQMEQALDLAKRYDNVWLELSSQSLSNVRRIIEEGPADRLLFGTDWPFYSQAIALAKVLIATEGDEAARRRVLSDNALTLVGLQLTDLVSEQEAGRVSTP